MGQVKAQVPAKGWSGARIAPPHPPVRGSSPAAAEEDQVLHGGDGGAGILACDEVAVQHHMHGVGFTGCRMSGEREPQAGSPARHVLRISPFPLSTTPTPSSRQPAGIPPPPAHH